MFAKDIFINFMNKMSKWESYAISIGLASNIDEHKKIVSDIFSKYCDINNRKMDKPNVLSASSISNYDLETQPIYDIKNEVKKTIIYTKQINKAKNNFRYTLVLKNDKWFINKKEVSYDEGKSWERSIL